MAFDEGVQSRGAKDCRHEHPVGSTCRFITDESFWKSQPTFKLCHESSLELSTTAQWLKSPQRPLTMSHFAGLVPRAIGAIAVLALAAPCARSQETAPSWRPFELRCVDASTGEGIPLVTLETVHAVSYVTDNAGRIAYDEPQHEGKRIFFKILAHGYKVPRDAFDAAGVVISIASGGRHEIRLERQQAAERLARLTGADRYRDSRMLGYETPRDDGLGVGNVAGQDSVQAVIYQDSVRWFWGDTLRLAYPLGLFRTAGARTPLDALARIDLRQGLPLSYVTDRD